MNFKTCMNEGNVTIQEWRSGVVWADEAVPYLRLKWLQKYQKYATLKHIAQNNLKGMTVVHI